ncbi:helix-turn-helix transcriptional regulator [Halobellus rarus]|uniref:Helix-turn-helix transcriptional regulator n=1 Tax=Halobellus rarus TaxID=1126237 RepID=A0ABD6CU54_9EURY
MSSSNNFDFTGQMSVPPSTEIQKLVAKRSEYLDALLENRFRKTELEDELSAPRSTVDRSIRELETAGLVQRVDGEFMITKTGEFAYRRYTEYASWHQTLSEAQPILNTIDYDIPTEVISNAEVYNSLEHFPDNPVVTPVELISESPYFKGITPIVMSTYIERIPGLLDQGIEYTGITTPDVVESVRNSSAIDLDFPDDSDGSYRLLVTEIPFSFALWIIEPNQTKHVGITAHNESGTVGAIISKHPTVVEWGEQIYEEYAERAEGVI